MRRVWTVLRRWGPASIEYVPHGAVLAPAFGTLLFDVRTFDEFLVWGAWGAVSGLLFGTVGVLLADRPTRRRRERARELLGASATDPDCDAAIRASVRGPVPADPAIRAAAGRMAAEDLGNWPLSLVGFGMVSDQLDACRRHRRTTRLQAGTDA